MNKNKKQTTSIDQPSVIYNYGQWILMAVALLLYLPALKLDLTKLDDTIFINDKHDFLSKLTNLPSAFTQGVFGERDIYYRPLLLVYFMFVYPFTSTSSIVAYHVASIMLHIVNVLLIYRLLNKVNIRKPSAFWLTLFFAMHPALTMAVAWIPGVNDLLLTTFALLCLLQLLRYHQSASGLSFLLVSLFFGLTIFTKESGIFLFPAGVLLIFYKEGQNVQWRRMIPLCSLQFFLLVIWFFARKQVLPDDAAAFLSADMVGLFFNRLQGLLQYLGKSLLPINLSVFPTIVDTSLLPGIVALIVLIILLYLNKERNAKHILIGFAWFFLFLMPIFFVPKNVSDQLFEHRLYLPLIGILLVIYETALFQKSFNHQIKTSLTAIVLIFFGWSVIDYTKYFNDPLVFWENAVSTSPNSAYANKLYAVQLSDGGDPKNAIIHFEKAFELDSTERYTKYFLATLVNMPKQDWNGAIALLDREIASNPNFVDAYAAHAQCNVNVGKLEEATVSLKAFLKVKPNDQMYNNNLLLLLRSLGKYKEAKIQADTMIARQLIVDEGLLKLVTDSANIVY